MAAEGVNLFDVLVGEGEDSLDCDGKIVRAELNSSIAGAESDLQLLTSFFDALVSGWNQDDEFRQGSRWLASSADTIQELGILFADRNAACDELLDIVEAEALVMLKIVMECAEVLELLETVEAEVPELLESGFFGRKSCGRCWTCTGRRGRCFQ